MTVLYFFLSKSWCIFWYLSSNSITGVLFNSICIFFLVYFFFRRKSLQSVKFHLILLSSVQTKVLLNSSVLHPSFIKNILEEVWHCTVKFIIRSFFIFIFRFLVHFSHNPVQEPHTQIAIISILSPSEQNITFLKHIARQCLSVVNWSNTLINRLIYIMRFSQRVLSLHIWHYLSLEMPIQNNQMKVLNRHL